MKHKSKKTKRQKDKKKFKPWFLNKIEFIRKISKPLAARANRWGGPSGVALVILLLIVSLLSPKNEIQVLKIHLLNNPYDFETHLALAEKLLNNNQFEEAEKLLLLAQKLQAPISNAQFSNNFVLGEKSSTKLEELWQKKHYSDPQDIQHLITSWEKIIKEKPNFRDGYLQLAILYYKIYENEKAKESLKKALLIDPNFEPSKELKKIILPL